MAKNSTKQVILNLREAAASVNKNNGTEHVLFLHKAVDEAIFELDAYQKLLANKGATNFDKLKAIIEELDTHTFQYNYKGNYDCDCGKADNLESYERQKHRDKILAGLYEKHGL